MHLTGNVFEVYNWRSRALVLLTEPLGESYEVAPGETVIVELLPAWKGDDADAAGALRLGFGVQEDTVVVSAEVGSRYFDFKVTRRSDPVE